MLVVILGAGASYDSDPESQFNNQAYQSPHRPPLAKELFDNRFAGTLDTYPQCAGLIPALRAACRAGNVETELEQLRDAASTYDHLPRALAAIRFYLRDVIVGITYHWLSELHGVTVYAWLLERLERWRHDSGERIVFITFNYDTLLEEAARRVLRKPFRRIDDYIADEHYKIIKLHGSTSWQREAISAGPLPEVGPYYGPTNHEHNLIEGIGVLHMRDRYCGDGDTFTPGTIGFPAIAIPTATKTESDFECPTSHLQYMDNALRGMTRLLIIGWRGAEAHFMTRWQEVDSPDLRHVQICDTPEGAPAIEQALLATPARLLVEPALLPFPAVEPISLRTGFASAIRSNEIERVLRG